MKLIDAFGDRARRLLAWLVDRHQPDRGGEILDDVIELYLERRVTRGRTRAVVRAMWDIVTLALRSSRSIRPTNDVRKGAMPRTIDDLRHALRAILRRPAMSLTVVMTLSLGVGLAALTFSLVDAVLVRALPFPRGHELLSIYGEFRPESGYVFDRFALSGPEIHDYQQQSRTVDVAAWTPASIALTRDDGGAEPLAAVQAASGVFALLETPPAMGRLLTAADDRPGAPCVAVLSHGLWQDTFGGAADVVGRSLTLSSGRCEMVGVMPRHFAFPGEATRLWLPLTVDPDPNTRGNHGLVAIGRLRVGVTHDAAHAELRTLMAAWARDYPHHRGHGIVIASLKDDLTGPVSRQLTILGCAVGLVLVVIAANVASLLLAHGEARRTELAVRSALGAPRASLVRQLVFEGLMLAAFSGGVGIVLAWGSTDAVLAVYPQTLPRAGQVQVDGRVVMAASLISLVIGFIVGIVPAVRLTRQPLADALKSSARGEGLSLNVRTQGWLVATELALAVAVTAGATLLVRSVSNLQRVPLGFDSTHVAIAPVSLPDREDVPPAEAALFFGALTTRLRGLPTVEAAGAISNVPLLGSPPPDDFTIEGRPVARPGEPGFNAHYVQATPGAIEALRIQVVRGRSIGVGDIAGRAGVALINETSARTFWPSADPIGQRIRYATAVVDGEWAGWGPWLTIVGVVQDVHFVAPATPAAPAIFVSHAQRPREAYDGRTMNVVLRTDASRQDLAAAVRDIARGLHGTVSVSSMQSMDVIVRRALARPRFMGWLMAVFAMVSVGVAAFGVYGVVAYGVQRRTREIGVRIALGASRRGILTLIARQTCTMAVAGLLAGIAASIWLARSMTAMLFGTGPFDLSTYVAVVAVFVVAVALAIVVPARRAMAVDPLMALRTD